MYREEDNGYLENLWLIEQADSTYTAFLVQYEFTPEDITALNFRQQINVENKITYIELNADELVGDIFGKYYYNGACYEDLWTYQSGTRCRSTKHTFAQGNECDYWGTTDMATNGGYVLLPTLVPCGDGGGGPSNGGNPPDYNPTNPNGNPNHGGGNQGGSTTPVTCKFCPELEPPMDNGDNNSPDQKNCDELNRIGNSTYTASAFNTLNNNLSQNAETGFSLDIRANFPNFAVIPKPPVSYSEVSAGQNPFSFAFLHNHFIGKFEMFGHGDIHTLFRYANNFNPSLLPNYQFDNSLFTIFMTVRDHTYAIKIEDIDKLASIQQYFVDETTEEAFQMQLDRVFKDANRDAYGNRKPNPADADQEELAKAFLKFVSETNDFGIALYKANTNDMLSQNATWQKLSLDTNGNITPTNCN
ncbi:MULTISPECIES: hypothetical protein [Bizionia]|uniref:Uncharacterized protein n=1 Tax=Bizionia algoritergicola TaxID=291187 RepID=A0A5D0R1T4_9FLAO|nr:MULTISPECIES: hypothetical protein [Bizionia]OBX23735.1 hypothetical protein BAA08_03520 [Bizionia sp. APA-3]TYB75457.1 hypothetical protein ES675_04855 [Bizionia algoritergicola]